MAAGCFPFAVAPVVSGDCSGDINSLGTWHAVVAARAPDLHPGIDDGCNLAQHLPVILHQNPGEGVACGPEVLFEHLHVVHAGKHHRDLLLIPKPQECPLGRAVMGRMVPEGLHGILRKLGNQLTSPERLHDHDRDPLAVGIFQPPSSCLRMLIHIIILDLAEIPVISVYDLAEHITVPMIGKPDLPDLSAGLLLFQPFLDPELLELFPCRDVIQHMHEIIVNIIRTQPAQMLIEVFVQGFPGADQVVRQLGCDIDLFPDLILLKDLTDRLLASRVDIGSVKIIDACLICAKKQLLRSFLIDPAVHTRKAHAAKAKNRQLVPITVFPVLHRFFLPPFLASADIRYLQLIFRIRPTETALFRMAWKSVPSAAWSRISPRTTNRFPPSGRSSASSNLSS